MSVTGSVMPNAAKEVDFHRALDCYEGIVLDPSTCTQSLGDRFAKHLKICESTVKTVKSLNYRARLPGLNPDLVSSYV